MAVPDAIRELHARWGIDRLDAGRHLSATPDELRAAGCSTAEMLRAAPREVLRRLDTREHTWELAAHTMLEAGMTPVEAIRQLALHAPTPETFAAGVSDIEVNPAAAFPTAVREACVPDVVALSERYGLSPGETAEVLAAACAPPNLLAQVVLRRCDGDEAATTDACRPVLDPHAVQLALRDDTVMSSATPLHSVEPAELSDEFDRLRAALGDPVESPDAAICTDEGLIDALDAAVAGVGERGLERDGRE